MLFCVLYGFCKQEDFKKCWGQNHDSQTTPFFTKELFILLILVFYLFINFLFTKFIFTQNINFKIPSFLVVIITLFKGYKKCFLECSSINAVLKMFSLNIMSMLIKYIRTFNECWSQNIFSQNWEGISNFSYKKLRECSINITLRKLWDTLYFKVSLLQCNYTFKYWVILINYMYLLYG